ncbi:protein of unknown function [Streptomyces sp. KY75]|nr:protein of unknown function [Streptomyces sp. KY75]CAD5987816.1 protein of unknown function [Streptomyces sp. KY70]
MLGPRAGRARRCRADGGVRPQRSGPQPRAPAGVSRRLPALADDLGDLLARLGLLGRAYRSLTAALPLDAAADMRAEGYTVAMTRTRGRELEDAAGDLRALLENPPGLAGLPVTVVSAGRFSPGMPKAVRERATVSHAYRARQSPHGRHVVLPEADHMVLTTSAAELAEEVRRSVVRLQLRRPTAPYRAPPANGISVAGAGRTGPAGCVQSPASSSRGRTPSPNQYASSRCG